MLLKSILPLAISLLSTITGFSINNTLKEINTLETPLVKQYNLGEQSPRASSGTYSVFNEVCREIETLVGEGRIELFHLKYYKDPYYQIPYLKFKKKGMLTNYWYNKTEDQIKSYINMYSTVAKFFTGFNKKLNTPISDL